MSTRKTEERNIRSLTKASNGISYYVTIPIEYVRKLKWKAKQKLVVRLYQGRIVISDWEE